MPLALFLLGAIFTASGIKGTTSQLSTLLAGDFHGGGNFFAFIIGIAVVGYAGNIPSLRSTSRLLIVLILIVLLLSNKGFFAQLQAFSLMNITPAAAPNNPVPTQTTSQFASTFGLAAAPAVAHAAAHAAAPAASFLSDIFTSLPSYGSLLAGGL